MLRFMTMTTGGYLLMFENPLDWQQNKVSDVIEECNST